MKTSLFYWISAVLYSLFIFLLSFFALPFADLLGGDILYSRAIFPLSAALTGLLGFLLWKYRLRMTPARVVCLAAVFAVFAVFYFKLDAAVEEIHLINFAVLTVLFKKAFENSGSRHAVWNALLVSLAIGMLDEFLQTFVPGRFGQWHDVGLCAAGALLGAALVWIFSRDRTARS